MATPAPAALPWVIVTTSNASALTNALNGVSCTSANACTAVGDYFATAATQQTLIEASNGGTWSIVTSPNSSTTETNVLFGVSCVSSAVCTAVGTYIPAGGLDQSLIESWDGTSWSIVESPNTSQSEDNELLGVSCTSAMACTAVGLHGVVGNFSTLVETWDGTNWSIATSPTPSATLSELQGVSCISPTACTAVGEYETASGNPQTLIESSDGTTWSTVASPDTSPTGNDDLVSVSCTSATSCTAVGRSIAATGNAQTLVERWDGNGWSIATSVNTSPTDDNRLLGVSCVSSTACTAAGGSAFTNTLVEGWDGTSWSIAATPNAPGSDVLQAVSCTSADRCAAVGGTNNGVAERTLAIGISDNDLAITAGESPPPVAATSAAGAAVTFTAPTASDEDGAAAVTCTDPSGVAHISGDTFPVGQTTLTCTASDADDSPATVSTTLAITVTVSDADLAITPGISPPVAQATSSAGAPVGFAVPSAIDEAGESPPVVCADPSGVVYRPNDTFPLGSTVLTCSVTDPDDTPSTAATALTVTVTDTDLGITAGTSPPPINATSSSGATVGFTSPMASDEDGSVAVSCNPTSGSVFPIGTTLVTCNATDGDDTPSAVSTTFTVTVKGALSQVQDLLAWELSRSIPPGTSFPDKAQAAISSLQAAPPGVAGACDVLLGTVGEAGAQSGKQLTSDQANYLIATAARIETVLACPAGI